MQLGELIEKMTTSDRLVIINAAGQVQQLLFIRVILEE